ncbi:MAG: hypothetical protein JXI43_09245 [Tissierellales bacterium]|nr:hypothetical protein [Tissierellales bacterium]
MKFLDKFSLLELPRALIESISKIKTTEQFYLLLFIGFLSFCVIVLFLLRKKGIRKNISLVRIMVYLVFYLALIFGFSKLINFNLKEIAAFSYNTRKLEPYEGNDGSKAEFKMFILSQEYNWQQGEDDKVEFNNRLKNIRPHLQAILANDKSIKGIVCVGTASRVGIRGESQELAKARALQLKLWIQRTSKSQDLDFIFELSVGQYNKPNAVNNPRDTKDNPMQRRIVIIGVTNYEEGISFTTALKNSLEKKYDPPLPFKIGDYSKFELVNSTLFRKH